ncbi:MAG TPA: CoA transferase [Ktedonobacterales bacterium]|nr:CoA transferase [Ktedonobacterales bacterium]
MSPLDGVRVVDLTRALAGPFCTMILGDLGAEVIKVEQPGVGDDARHWGPPFKNGESAYFLNANRNKRGITLNLKREGAREVLWRLIEQADVFIENFRPGLIGRLGFGYDEAIQRNPRLIYCSISAYGQDGPDALRPGYDIILQGMSGATSVTGDPDGSPYRAGMPICDILSGMFAGQGILAALHARERTGRGQRVETTLLGATVAAMANLAGSYLMTGEAPARVGNSHPQIAPYDLVRTADGYVNVAGANADLWRNLCGALHLEPLLDDPRFATNGERVHNRKALLAAIEERTTRLSTAELLETLDAAGVPAGPIRDLKQVFESPQALHMGLALSQPHPTVGEARSVNTPLRLSETPPTMRFAAPTLGQHTDDVLRELGYDEATVRRWHDEGTV